MLTAIPWQHQPEEPDHWFDRFDKYGKTLGYEFSVVRMYRMYCVANPDKQFADALPIWTEIANTWQWATRAKEWAEFDRQETQAKFKQRRDELLNEDWDTGSELRKIARQFVEALPLHREIQRITDEEGNEIVTLELNITAGQLATLLKTSSELQRLGIGEPTQIHGVATPGVSFYLPSIQTPIPASEPTEQETS